MTDKNPNNTLKGYITSGIVVVLVLALIANQTTLSAVLAIGLMIAWFGYWIVKALRAKRT